MIYTLLVGHFVADWLAQSDWMALNKSKRWDALVMHVSVYIGVMALIIMVADMMFSIVQHGVSSPGRWFYVNLTAHFVQDAITSRITSRLWFFAPAFDSIHDQPVTWAGQQVFTFRGGNRHWFFVTIGFDQLLHYIVLFKTAEWVAPLNEGSIKGRLMVHLKATMPGFMIERHEEVSKHGWPDISVTGCGWTSFYEVKYLHPSFESEKIQTVKMWKLAQAGFARYILYREVQETRHVAIVHPRDIFDVRTGTYRAIPETWWVPGFNHVVVAHFIFNVHQSNRIIHG